METGSKRRRRLLHACGVSAFAIAHKTYGRAEEVHGPIGSVAHRLASLSKPIASSMASQCLAIISMADDQINSVENVIETLIPSSSHVFDKIESFVYIPETLPGKFDHLIDVLINRVPLLRFVLTLMILALNFIFATFMADDSAKEKDIMVDINCNEDQFAPKSASINNPPPIEDEILNNEPFPSLPVSDPLTGREDEAISKSSMDKSPPAVDPLGDQHKNPPTEALDSKETGPEIERPGDKGGDTMKQIKITYKEVLKKGNKGDDEKKERCVEKEPQKHRV